MPYLSDEDAKALREANRSMAENGANICKECGGYITLRYDERSDEHFSFGHGANCSFYKEQP